jgi:hypothetical protein
MRTQHWLLIGTLVVGQVGSAWAGPFSFLRRNRQQQEPQQNQPAAPAAPVQDRVSELIVTLKTDQDAGRRQAAAQELRNHDVRTHPAIVPVLIEAAQRDARPEVRLEAVQSLGRIRPVSADIGRVIEQVVSSDSSMRVRMSARSTLLQYQLAGYRGGNTASAGQGPPLPSTTQEPPLAEPAPAGPLLVAPEAQQGPSLYPQPMPQGPAVYPPVTPPQQPRLAPIPAGRRPTSWRAPGDQPLENGTPLSSYRLIQPPPPVSEADDLQPTVAPLHHEEVAPADPPSRPLLRKFMVNLPATPLEAPAAPVVVPQPTPVEVIETPDVPVIGPMLNAPQ